MESALTTWTADLYPSSHTTSLAPQAGPRHMHFGQATNAERSDPKVSRKRSQCDSLPGLLQQRLEISSFRRLSSSRASPSSLLTSHASHAWSGYCVDDPAERKARAILVLIGGYVRFETDESDKRFSISTPRYPTRSRYAKLDSPDSRVHKPLPPCLTTTRRDLSPTTMLYRQCRYKTLKSLRRVWR
jgi:hypothetical protein